ncbi:two-component system phosphate regulon sensor histidine kinase PhoR [Caldanaerobacter subterraneus subsp. tengcongensis MB4]|uniref:histidine kinase n=1 Tax=Caldanaerobacter subterraneus subsp. tengcongensis (strain DSM 15242 / JCM 11007 / NBRC 100824 / MB4) TaxID=273068 RepID=Q8R9H8_CALS4|nr:ATP-binding protein [Caldanaerobacter subterraneus]AAM24834.1 Sensory transduction histidine kinases [Caldanaerobacter subterraneus subsp. tengcongensis MB4]MCS3915596.1 two-component system phosphate regulon sensor histidine kinase PhoR [Caldanaerobacter subterraneus subsp. tengcongensis MB4]
MLRKSYYRLFFINLIGILTLALFFWGKVSIENLLIGVGIALFISFVLSYRFLRRIIDPLQEITEVTKDIANGIYHHGIKDNSIDEIRELYFAVSSMSHKLRETIEELNDRNATLEAILKSIANGVIAFDNAERILMMNDSAKKILGIEEKDLTGRRVFEVIRSSKLYEVFETLRKNKVLSSKSLELNFFNKHLKVYISPILHPVSHVNLGFVLVIDDITEMRKLEKIRSEFVANVSHELRTPLTSIRGFIETLRSGAIENPEAREKFLDIIDFEAERLTRLINDILTLSEIENVKEGYPVEKIEMDKEIEDILYIMEKAAKDKSITLKRDLNCGNLTIIANRDRFHQMMINLIDNGIKYTQEGGFVKVSTRLEGEKIIIEVEDNGIGIPKDKIPRLFERFYRVDKSRSRKLGGTGLGLAIVKHIVESMKGEISVESEVGKGTKFTIRFNRKDLTKT